MTAVIAAASTREELVGLEPLGWFRSHPRSDLSLTEHDLEIANALFPQPWQIGLVMRPANSALTRARFYYREVEGSWTVECAVREFTLPPVEAQPGLDSPEETDLRRDARDARDMGLPEEMEEFLPSSRRRPPLRTRAWRWPLALIAAAGVAGGIYWFTQSQELSLGVTDSGGQLRIAWDRMARPVRNSKTGHLEIVDGGQKLWIELDAEQLRVGNVTCQRRSNDVTVKLVVQPESGSRVEDVARFMGLGPAPQAPSAGNQTASGKTEAPAENPPELVVPVPVQRGEPDAPAAERPKFQEPRTEANRTVPVESAPPPVLTPAAQTARSEPAPPVQMAVHAEPPPEKQTAAAAQRTVKATPAPPPAAATGQAPAHVTAAPRAPASGRVIWIGRLPKNQPVTISGKNCSVGTITGELPARAFRFSVSPGDLANDGIVLYTSNLQYANSVVEPPGAENGWNKTVYTWNPKYANDVSVEEAPTAQNGWNRITLRSKNAKISVIVIDWTTVN